MELTWLAPGSSSAYRQTDRTHTMIVTSMIAVFFVIVFVLNIVMCLILGLGDYAVVTAFALTAVSIIGFAFAMSLVIVRSVERQFKRIMTFSAITSVLCVSGTYLEPGRMFGWAFSASFPLAKAGMSGYLIGLDLALTFRGARHSEHAHWWIEHMGSDKAPYN